MCVGGQGPAPPTCGEYDLPACTEGEPCGCGLQAGEDGICRDNGTGCLGTTEAIAVDDDGALP